MKATEVDALMDRIDADGSGAVDMDEFHNWLFGTEGQWLGKLRRCDARDPQNNARLMRREMLRFDPTVRELLRGFWVLSDADGSGSIDREEYMDLHLHLYAAMNVEVTRAADALEEGLRGKDGWKEAARAIAAREWEFDAQGRDFLDEHLFGVSLFQLVDAWGGDGPDKTASVLAKFLCFLMDRLSEIDDDRDAVVFKWADENEDWLDELKPIQDVLGSIEDLDTCLENGARKLQYLVPLGGDDWTGSDLDASSESSGDECPEASSDGESRDFVPGASRGDSAAAAPAGFAAEAGAVNARGQRVVHRTMGGKKKLFNKTSRKSLDAIGGMLGISPGQLQAAAEEANRLREAERRESQANDIDADTAAAAPRPEALAVGDFLECRKYVFPPKGSSTTPPHSLAHTFKFKDYAPEAFSRIRDIFDVRKTDYITSICGTQYFLNFISNSKSQQYFFYSHDGKFLIKTQTQEEVKFLRRMLPAYYAHLKKHPGSLMTRYLGMSRIKFYHLRRKVRFVVMHSVHPTPLHVHRTYDLKGCTHGRRTTEKERDRDRRLGIGLHLKDLDLVDDDFRLALRARQKDVLLTQLAFDVAFLKSQSIMDYSLLIGVHDPALDDDGERRPEPPADAAAGEAPARVVVVDEPAPLLPDFSCGLAGPPAGDPAPPLPGAASSSTLGRAASGDESDDDPDEHPLTLAETAEAQIQLKRASRATPDDGGLRALSDRRDLGITATDDALPGGAQKTYFLGIIDVLIKYNAKKRAETFVKTFKAKREAISSVPPDEYAARFLRFCEDVVLKDAEAK